MQSITLTGYRKSWGQSAAAKSVALQMVANGNTEGLFRGASIESGAVNPNEDIVLSQQDYV